MRIAITAYGPTLEADVDPRFGRCTYFLIVDPDTLDFEAVENANASLGQGAGIQSAQTLAGLGVEAVLTGNCGPNAHETLAAAGIEVMLGRSGSVMQAIGDYKAGHLTAASEPNVSGHSGRTAHRTPEAEPSTQFGQAAEGRPPGRQAMQGGMGRGGGRGQGGRGRGMGRGRGRGGGAA